MMTFLLCLGSVALLLQQIRKGCSDAAAKLNKCVCVYIYIYLVMMSRREG